MDERGLMHKTPSSYKQLNSPLLLTVARILSMMSALISAPIIARTVGPSGRGVTASILAASGVLPLLLAGGLPVAVRILATGEDSAKVLRSARIGACALFPVALFLGLADAHYLIGTASFELKVWAVINIGISFTAISVLCDQSLCVIQGNYFKISILQVGQQLMFVAGVATSALLGVISTTSVLQLSAFSTGSIFILSRWITGIPWSGSRMNMNVLWRTSIRFWGSAAAEAASNRADQALMLPLIGSTQAGYYSVAASLASAPIVLGHSVGVAFYAHYARYKSGATTLPALKNYSRVAAICGVVSTVLLSTLSIIVIPVLYGERFRGAILPLALLSIGTFCLVVSYVATTGLVIQNQPNRLIFIHGSGLFLGLALLWVLRREGAVGAALADTCGSLLSLILAIFFLRDKLLPVGIKPRDIRATFRFFAGIDREISSNETGK